MSKAPTFVRGALLGSALMYLFDPARGRARRARIRAIALHARVREQRFLQKAARDAQHRVHGFFEQSRQGAHELVDDAVLEARVRSRLGRAGSHVRALEVSVRGGEVTLRGPALMREANAIIRCVKAVSGVREVDDQLERHATADISALQGHIAPPGRSGMWPPAGQLGAIAGGVVMATWGLLARRGITGAILASAGGALALRGGLNIPFASLVEHAAGRRGIEVSKTVTVRAPIDRVFGMWRHVENFPRFMQHVQSVIVDDRDQNRSRWTVDGPGGIPIELESAITRIVHLREIWWRTLPNQRIEHAGVARFEPVLGGTRVTIRMHYRPPGGLVGHAIAHVLGWDPKARLDGDMLRMKTVLEQGHTRAHGSRVAIKDLLH